MTTVFSTYNQVSEKKRQTRLETHRDLYNSGNRKTTLLRFEELSAREARMVNRDVFASIRESADDPYKLYARVLSSWGVMCPHPQSKRLYAGLQRFHTPQPASRYHWYSCECCGSLSVNLETSSSVRVTKKS